MKAALLTLIPAVTLVMLKVGLFVSKMSTCNTSAWVAVTDNASVTFTLKLNVPLLAGVPARIPLVAKVKPFGNAPELVFQL